MIAFLRDDDPLNRQALDRATSLSRETLVTSEYVMIELLNHAGKWKTKLRNAAVDLARAGQDGSGPEIITSNTKWYAGALELYTARPDKQWSFTDCASFVIMRQLGISEALSADHHFEQAGFTILLK